MARLIAPKCNQHVSTRVIVGRIVGHEKCNLVIVLFAFAQIFRYVKRDVDGGDSMVLHEDCLRSNQMSFLISGVF